MNFSDPIFIFLFLPIAWIGWFIAGRLVRGVAPSIVWIVCMSILFYGWLNLDHVAVMLGSVVFNYAAAILIDRRANPTVRQAVVCAGVAANLGLLVFFKYPRFLLGLDRNIAMPLAISFFTFHQISYLVDVYRGLPAERNPVRFTFYIVFFPHLIAGPVLNYRDIGPQLAEFTSRRLKSADFTEGFTRFLTGLAKKLLIADTLAPLVVAAYGLPEKGEPIGAALAWAAVAAFYFQIYFDFSGYTDMALGLARMFGVTFGENFDNPYRAGSPIEFWRRWHITLSTFLRNYLYIPLGGNRHGRTRQMAAIFATMLIGGLWHGAGWNFVLWGGLHGAALVGNHLLRAAGTGGGLSFGVTAVATQLFVLSAWIPFRAADLSAAWTMFSALGLKNGFDFAQLQKLLQSNPLPLPATYLGSIDPQLASVAWFLIAAAAAVHLTWRIGELPTPIIGQLSPPRIASPVMRVGRAATYAGLHLALFAALAVRIVESSVVQPFIYFQF
jgi:D-alanyl-lipoteichoic acid acyltransferase DltB (MBOAT superfamily)